MIRRWIKVFITLFIVLILLSSGLSACISFRFAEETPTFRWRTSTPTPDPALSKWQISQPQENKLLDIWGITENDVYAVGAEGTIVHYDGQKWQSLYSGTTEPLFGIWGTSADNIYAVGNRGTMLHYNGTAWSTINVNTEDPLFDIWGSGPSDIYVPVFGDDTMLHYDG